MIMRKDDKVLKKIEELRQKIDSEFPPEADMQNPKFEDAISSYIKNIKTPANKER